MIRYSLYLPEDAKELYEALPTGKRSQIMRDLLAAHHLKMQGKATGNEGVVTKMFNRLDAISEDITTLKRDVAKLLSLANQLQY